jgi:hypothetical protein
MSVRLVKLGERRIGQPGLWADAIRPNRTVADDVTMTLDGLARQDDLQVMMGCTLLGQRLGKTLAENL